MKLFHFFVIAAIALSACQSGKAQKAETTDNTQEKPKSFTLPEIPAMYTTPEQRADFLVKHYWDNFDFTDTTYIHKPDITEQAFVDFLDVTNHSPIESSREGIRRLMTSAEQNKIVFDYFVSLAEKYLYDPNSPFRNEEFYIVVLEQMIASNLLDDTEKTRPRYRLDLAMKNRVGTKAINFTYTTKSGKQGSLHDLSTEYTLLYFNNPGCHACEEITESIKQSRLIDYLLAEKRITILCVYPDEELDEWKKHYGDFPSTWINSFDKGTVIRNKNLYDLKAIPTLYLLDKNKIVLLKDATFPQIEQFLSNNM